MRAGAVADVCEEGVAVLLIFCTSRQFDSHTRNTARSMMPMQTAAKPQLGVWGQGDCSFGGSLLMEIFF